jgi:hypothetical protein
VKGGAPDWTPASRILPSTRRDDPESR